MSFASTCFIASLFSLAFLWVRWEVARLGLGQENWYGNGKGDMLCRECFSGSTT